MALCSRAHGPGSRGGDFSYIKEKKSLFTILMSDFAASMVTLLEVWRESLGVWGGFILRIAT